MLKEKERGLMGNKRAERVLKGYFFSTLRALITENFLLNGEDRENRDDREFKEFREEYH